MDAPTRVAFIGAGRMGASLIKGLVVSRTFTSSQITVSDKDPKKLEELQKKYDIRISPSNAEAASLSDVILLAVKPREITEVGTEIKNSLKDGCTVISIAAGVRTSFIEAVLGEGVPVVRVMPNSAAQVKAAISVISPGKFAKEEDVTRAEAIFASVGVVGHVDEELQNAVTALSGSGPAYFYLLVDALAEAGVEAGLDRETAISLAHETMFGASRMLKMTNYEPQELIDMVVSPGGTTEAALKVFETKGFKSMTREAFQAALKRAGELEE